MACPIFLQAISGRSAGRNGLWRFKEGRRRAIGRSGDGGIDGMSKRTSRIDVVYIQARGGIERLDGPMSRHSPAA
jgi:restriction endonuclease Mrr